MAELLNNMNVWMVLYCAQQLLGLKKKQKPFLHLSLSKASPFTLGNHICIKALKYKVFQIIRCLIKPLLKNSTQTIFQGGTPWVAQLLNNMNVWMVLYVSLPEGISARHTLGTSIWFPLIPVGCSKCVCVCLYIYRERERYDYICWICSKYMFFPDVLSDT